MFYLLFAILLAGSFNYAEASNDNTLELLQVFLRHGNRTALSTFDAYVPWLIETFKPFQFGQLTPQGRRQMFNTGSYVRDRYNDFLPEEFSYTDVSVMCTEMDRVQESSAVAMAAMFPPKNKQKWQDSGLGSLYTPIPCTYIPADQDTLLEPDSTNCSRYSELSSAWYSSPEYMEIYNVYTRNGAVNTYIQNQLNMTEPFDALKLGVVWENLEAMDTYDVPLPSWAAEVYPEPLKSIYNLGYGMVYRSQELIRFAAGEFMKQILEQATMLQNGLLEPKSRKVYAYVGHDKTIYPMLVALGFETFPPMVPFGAAFLMELHRNQTTSEIGYRFLYQNATWAEPIRYIIPGCQEICPLSFVKQKLSPYIPTKPFFDYC